MERVEIVGPSGTRYLGRNQSRGLVRFSQVSLLESQVFSVKVKGVTCKLAGKPLVGRQFLELIHQLDSSLIQCTVYKKLTYNSGPLRLDRVRFFWSGITEHGMSEAGLIFIPCLVLITTYRASH